MYRALEVWCVKNYFLTPKRLFFYLIAMKINRQILSLGETLVYVHLEKLCLFWSIQFYCRGKRNRKLITITLIIITTIICIVGSVLDSGMCFWILGSVIWILGCAFGFCEVLWILGSVSVSGKCAPAFCWLPALRSLFSWRLASPQNLSLLN